MNAGTGSRRAAPSGQSCGTRRAGWAAALAAAPCLAGCPVELDLGNARRDGPTVDAVRADGERPDGAADARGSCEEHPTEACGTGVRSVALGADHSCAVMRDGTVRCWGANGFRQLGDGTTVPRARPTIVAGLANVVEVAPGGYHTCARRDDGTVHCWGSNAVGQLGNERGAYAERPTAVTGLAGVAEVTSDRDHSCARMRDGTVRCWGENSFGQLGDGTRALRYVPATVLGLAGVDQVRTATAHSCARAGGAVHCWGANTAGQLGTGVTSQVEGAVATRGLTAVQRVFVGGASAFALLEDGTVRAWGSNEYGALASTSGPASVPLPRVVDTLSDVAEIALGTAHGCARMRDGTVRCWGGTPGSGAAGAPLGASLPYPVTTVAGLERVVQIAAGRGHSCALRDDGEVLCWGANAEGQLGNGTGAGSPVPTRVVW